MSPGEDTRAPFLMLRFGRSRFYTRLRIHAGPTGLARLSRRPKCAQFLRGLLFERLQLSVDQLSLFDKFLDSLQPFHFTILRGCDDRELVPTVFHRSPGIRLFVVRNDGRENLKAETVGISATPNGSPSGVRCARRGFGGSRR